MCEIDWDGGRWNWFINTPRVAKKEHRCGTCAMPIRAGDPYLDHRHIFDGRLNAAKACAPCAISLLSFGEAHNFYTSPDFLEEFLRDCVVNEDEGKGGWRDDIAGIVKRKRAARRAELAGAKP